MKILVHSPLNDGDIETSLGLPDYSYHFVLRDFLPVLRELGEVRNVARPQTDVDPLFARAQAAGEPCLFLSFLPPQKTALGLACPTVPVFAWEFHSIPSESWLGDERQNWCHVLRHTGQAITHADFIVDAVKRELGNDYPIVAIPSPVWDKFGARRAARAPLDLQRRTTLHVRAGIVVDSRDPAMQPYIGGDAGLALVAEAISQHNAATDNRRASSDSIELRREREQALQVGNPVAPPQPSAAGLRPKLPDWTPEDRDLELSGVVFTSLFNPYDGRKNWRDMLTAFCAAFRDSDDATLLFKLSHHDYASAMHDMLITLARMPAFRCRVVLVHGFLADDAFDGLIDATTFIVNASHGEGQCLPLMEFLSCGVPAIAPRHSAMLDYIDGDIAFVVDSWLDATAWSHDPRLAYRTLRHQIDWLSLKNAYLAAYRCAREEPQRYARMDATAIERMQRHCSRASARERLQHFLEQTLARTAQCQPAPATNIQRRADVP